MEFDAIIKFGNYFCFLICENFLKNDLKYIKDYFILTK